MKYLKRKIDFFVLRKSNKALDDEKFRKHYRFHKSTATSIIDIHVRNDLQIYGKGYGTSPELNVLIIAIRCRVDERQVGR